ncbi:MAG TPA: peptidoglycan DD-metalloendopeptidase family protein [Solirubrobacterales bacterium]|nr:peptidoglycan DD-metalloendopeptidase family protein [Solirubrobacterales bacterium]
MNANGFARSWMAGKICIAVGLVLLLCLPGSAAATTATGGAGTPGAAPSAKGSPAGTPSPAPSAGVLSLLAAKTTPRKSFYFGYRYPLLSYTIGSSQPLNDIQIDVLDTAGAVVKTFYREDVAADVENKVRWDGTTNEGRPARNGRYSFRISPQGIAAPAARKATSSTALSLGFAFYGYAFPIMGAHNYGSGGSGFGAARSGHTHQGQDVMSACGVPLLAARGGTVQVSTWDDAAGNYVVIDGKGTEYDFMYAHMAEPSPLRVGETVRTGQPIGVVGTTGSSSACHLHFEMWSAPGWYEGGSPIDPLGYLQKWDAYS